MLLVAVAVAVAIADGRKEMLDYTNTNEKGINKFCAQSTTRKAFFAYSSNDWLTLHPSLKNYVHKDMLFLFARRVHFSILRQLTTYLTKKQVKKGKKAQAATIRMLRALSRGTSYDSKQASSRPAMLRPPKKH